MSEKISLILEFSALEGKLPQAEADMKAIFDVIDGAESDIHYEFYRDPARPNKIYALESHPNSESLLQHMQRVGPLIAKSRESANLDTMKVFGNATPALQAALAQMGQQAIPLWMGR
jgi:hypothetical protein